MTYENTFFPVNLKIDTSKAKVNPDKALIICILQESSKS